MPVHPLQQHLIGVSLHLRDMVASRIEDQMHMRVNKTGQQRDIAKINYGQPGRDAAASQINPTDTAPGHDDQRRTHMEDLTVKQACGAQPPPATAGNLRSILIHRVTSGLGGPPMRLPRDPKVRRTAALRRLSTKSDHNRIRREPILADSLKAQAPGERLYPTDRAYCTRGYKVWIRPPSMTKSAPVMFAARSLARNSTRSATSSGLVKRPVTIWLAAWLATSCAAAPVAALTVWATPPCPSHRSVATGPGLTVLMRIPRGPTSLESALQKLARPALATL